jgi:hypothetical protein
MALATGKRMLGILRSWSAPTDLACGRHRTDLELPRRKIGDVEQTAADARRLQMSWKENRMKMITYAMLALGLMAALPVEANAVVCARGPYRAGCAGPHGAVGVHRGYGYGYHGGAAVVRRGYGYHGGVRVYR